MAQTVRVQLYQLMNPRSSNENWVVRVRLRNNEKGNKNFKLADEFWKYRTETARRTTECLQLAWTMTYLRNMAY